MPANPAPQFLVSVIVPVYNVAAYVGECVSSLLNQTLKDIELIFIDDASTDGSLAILEAQTKGCSHVTIIRNAQNEGVGAARNHGIKVARAEYLKIIDSDDVLDDRALENLYHEAKMHDVDIVFHDAVLWNADGTRSLYPYPESSRELRRMNGHAAWWYLFKRSILTDHPHVRFPIGAHPHEDTTFSFMLYTYCLRSRYLPQGYLLYRQHEGMVMQQINSSKQEQNRRSAAICVCALVEFYEALPSSLRTQRSFAFNQISRFFYRIAEPELISPHVRWHFLKRKMKKVYYRLKRFLKRSKHTSSS
ncbi:MAG: glycosyltransferase family 2 protein [Verrucomicrobiota bacterium]